MSDERDPSALPRWEELLRRLDQTHRRLESAHADYLEASAESQRALTRVIEAFGDISETVRDLVPDPGDPSVHSEHRSVDRKSKASDEPDTNDDALAPKSESSQDDLKPAKNTFDDGDHAMASPSTSTDADQSQNALPARLHSRGIVIPDQADVPFAPEAEEDKDAPGPSSGPSPPVRSGPRIDHPTLIEAPYAGEQRAFSGLSKDSRIVLTNDGFGVASTLNEILSREGYRVRIESRRPELSSPADTVIFMGSLRAPSNLDDAMSIIDDAMYTAEKMTTRLMQPNSAFVAAVDTGGGFGLDAFDPVAAPFGALLGLVRLLDRRHPGARTKLIDLNGGNLAVEKIADLLAEELLNGADQSPIAIGADRRRSVEWAPFDNRSRPASWLEEERPPLVYMPGPNAVLSTAVERLAIAHELPVALLRRRHTSKKIASRFKELSIETRTTDYDLNRLFSVMDFLDGLRRDHGPIAAIVTESIPAKNPDDLARWEVMRPPLDEFNALLAMTINDPLRLLAVGLGPKTPPVVASALRYFARAESLRRNEHLQVRLAHLSSRPRRDRSEIGPRDFALTEFLAGAEPMIAEARFDD